MQAHKILICTPIQHPVDNGGHLCPGDGLVGLEGAVTVPIKVHIMVAGVEPIVNASDVRSAYALTPTGYPPAGVSARPAFVPDTGAAPMTKNADRISTHTSFEWTANPAGIALPSYPITPLASASIFS